jgi:hypothetical protein
MSQRNVDLSAQEVSALAKLHRGEYAGAGNAAAIKLTSTWLRGGVVWQQIETAPAGGKNVLTFSPDTGYKVAWSMEGETWVAGDEDEKSFIIAQPTHWMPLPSPPQD